MEIAAPRVVFCPVGDGSAFIFDAVDSHGIFDGPANQVAAERFLEKLHSCSRAKEDHYIVPAFDPFEQNGM